MTILLTHEWLAVAGGSENVFEQMSLALPKAEQWCLWNDDPVRFPDTKQTWLSRTPTRHHKSLALGLSKAALAMIPITTYEKVICSSHAFGHHTASRAASHGIPAFAYVHSPARYIWAPDLDPRGRSLAVRAVSKPLRAMDRHASSSQVSYAANSKFVHDRVQESWKKPSAVIHPPVDVDKIVTAMTHDVDPDDRNFLSSLPDRFILGASRLVEYKNLDLVIRLGESLNIPVIIAGDGPHRHSLATLAATSQNETRLVGHVSNRVLYELYRRCALYVYLSVEDFGIMPLEAIAAGAPVLVNSKGGSWEGVQPTGAGQACDPSDWPTVVAAAIEAMLRKSHAGSDKVLPFCNTAFRKRFLDWVGSQ